MSAVQLRLPWERARSPRPGVLHEARIGAERVAVAVVRHRRARRYVLRLGENGTLRLTVPRGASIAAGIAFAERQSSWVARERRRQESRQAPWVSGTSIWFRGETSTLAVSPRHVSLAGLVIGRPSPETAVRPLVESHLKALADDELSSRCRELARAHGIALSRVSVRNQRSRWGACSSRGVITLNWRLIQMPGTVADYIVCHELAHLRHANHSRRFWKEVERLYPSWRDAEAWIRRHGREIL
jgi:predicted metal-dependent hydrolase